MLRFDDAFLEGNLNEEVLELGASGYYLAV